MQYDIPGQLNQRQTPKMQQPYLLPQQPFLYYMTQQQQIPPTNQPPIQQQQQKQNETSVKKT